MVDEFTPEFFDKASQAWRKNKKRQGESWVYICTYIHSDGKRCNRRIYAPEIKYHITNRNVFCKQHCRRRYDPDINVWC